MVIGKTSPPWDLGSMRSRQEVQGPSNSGKNSRILTSIEPVMESMVEFRMSVLEGLQTSEAGINASWERQRTPTPSSTRHGLVGITKACMRVEDDLVRDSGQKSINTRICVFASMTSRAVELEAGCSSYCL
jgi:hypothetical protein